MNETIHPGHSLKTKVAISFFGTLFFILVCSWLATSFFLERYYVRDKEKALVNIYDTINSMTTSSLSDNDSTLALEQACENGNISLLVTDSSLNILFSTKNKADMENYRLYEYVYGIDYLAQRGENISFSADNVIQATDTYELVRNRDPRFDSDYLEMAGILNDSRYFVMRTPVESLREAASLSKLILFYIVLIALVLGGLFILIISSRMTLRLTNLMKVSDRMAHLDFDAKYEEDDADDEVSRLGESINFLSRKLEKTISELKTANNELKKDIAQKEQIDEMRKEFLSNVSHELKTPIALIQGYAEGLMDNVNDDPESRNFYCEVIADEAAKMNNMVQKLLSLNRIEFGKDAVVMERFDVTELIRTTVGNTSIMAEQKQVKVVFHDPGPVHVWGDAFAVEEVLTNYISNAFNHVENENKIEIRLEQEEFVARISVFNTGQPIPEEELDKIWIKFYKVDKARTREYGGSGIGLSIVKALMDSMHQQCGVKNYDNGVEFWFTLDTRQDEPEMALQQEGQKDI